MRQKDASKKVKTLRLVGILIVLAAAAFFRFVSPGSDSETAAESVYSLEVETTTAATTAPQTSETESTTAATTTAATTAAESTTAAATTAATTEATTEAATAGISVTRGGTYTDKEHVALYIKEYGELPDNYITKKEAEALGWPGGDLYKYADGKSIGGSYFGNYEGLLPEEKGRKYYECDIDYHGGSRGAKRLIYSSDGLFFYTDDHYESFTELIP